MERLERLERLGFDGILKLYKEGEINYREYLDSILNLSRYEKDIINTQKKGIEKAIDIIDTLKEAIENAKDIIDTLKNTINIIDTLKEAIEEAIKEAIKEAIVLGPEDDIETKILMLYVIDINVIPSDIYEEYGKGVMYKITDEKDENDYLNKLRKNDIYIKLNNEFSSGGSRRIKATPKSKPTPKSKAKPKHDEMTMKDIKEMCKANEIKLSKVVEGKRVAFKKKELITKLKRKKLL